MAINLFYNAGGKEIVVDADTAMDDDSNQSKMKSQCEKLEKLTATLREQKSKLRDAMYPKSDKEKEGKAVLTCRPEGGHDVDVVERCECVGFLVFSGLRWCENVYCGFRDFGGVPRRVGTVSEALVEFRGGLGR